jgi:hypothetical protein
MALTTQTLLPIGLATAALLWSAAPIKAQVSDGIPATPDRSIEMPRLLWYGETVLTPTSDLTPTQLILPAAKSNAPVPTLTLPQVTPTATLPQNATLPESTEIPVPGTAPTTAAALLNQSAQAQSPQSVDKLVPTAQSAPVAQATIRPGTATRSGSSYFGVGANIGIADGSTAVGDFSFAVFSKIGFTDRFSFRPAVLFGDDVTFLLPVTVDFPSIGSITNYGVFPYVGGGVAIVVEGDDTFNALLTAGVDVPLGDQFTATAAFNFTFLNDASFGVLLGIGYNF